jgi:hypothetical protein
MTKKALSAGTFDISTHTLQLKMWQNTSFSIKFPLLRLSSAFISHLQTASDAHNYTYSEEMRSNTLSLLSQIAVCWRRAYKRGSIGPWRAPSQSTVRRRRPRHFCTWVWVRKGGRVIAPLNAIVSACVPQLERRPKIMHPAAAWWVGCGVGWPRYQNAPVQHRDAQTQIEQSATRTTLSRQPGHVFCRLTQRMLEFDVKQHLLMHFWRRTTAKVSNARTRSDLWVEKQVQWPSSFLKTRWFYQYTANDPANSVESKNRKFYHFWKGGSLTCVLWFHELGRL